MGTKEDKASTGRVWATRFHNVTARFRLACVLKLMNHLFKFFSRDAVNREYGGTTLFY
jgi:hypothetical protein